MCATVLCKHAVAPLSCIVHTGTVMCAHSQRMRLERELVRLPVRTPGSCATALAQMLVQTCLSRLHIPMRKSRTHHMLRTTQNISAIRWLPHRKGMCTHCSRTSTTHRMSHTTHRLSAPSGGSHTARACARTAHAQAPRTTCHTHNTQVVSAIWWLPHCRSMCTHCSRTSATHHMSHTQHTGCQRHLVAAALQKHVHALLTHKRHAPHVTHATHRLSAPSSGCRTARAWLPWHARRRLRMRSASQGRAGRPTHTSSSGTSR